ncbi:MAG: hypothetical protein KDA52_12040 [Planctomycetaceae bacterium]|nr:hypothetical protein [Planctomycetaceae bacterium]
MTSEALVETLREQDSWWFRVRMTPWRDLLRGRLSGSLDYRDAMTEFDLPLPLLQTVDEVVQRSRLWPRERSDVAAELCAHFADGLQAGHSVEELQQSFGSAKESAQLIRRSKVRCRSLGWHLWRRTWQATFVSVVFLAAVCLFLLVRYVWAEPTITFDIVAEHDEINREIPEYDRAWPHYRNGLVLIDRRREFRDADGKVVIVEEGMEGGPSHPHWPQVKEYLAEMEVPIQLFIAGAQCEKLGFINRDPGNNAWRRWESPTGTWENYNEPGTPGYHILLAQAQDLRMVLRYLKGATYVALEEGDGQRAMILLSAMMNLPDHARQSFDGAMADLVAFAHVRTISQLVITAVLEYPDLFSADDLNRLSHGLEKLLGGRPFEIRWTGERRLIDDFLQQTFTEDGQGNGQFTIEGIRLLLSQLEGIGEKEMFPELNGLPEQAAEALENTKFELAAAAIIARIADRRTVQEKMHELSELDFETFCDPLTPLDESRFHQETESLLKSADRERLLPVAVLYGTRFSHNYNYGRQVAWTNMIHEAALASIALEQYRRRQGKWPDDLSALTPQFLPVVPRDPYSTDGVPLMYRVEGAQPLLYSIGPNRQDDGGTPPPDVQYPLESDEGDWVLLPSSEPNP